MPPPSTSPELTARVQKVPQRPGNLPEEQRPTTMGQPAGKFAAQPKSDQQLAQAFRSDLQAVRTLITCTICDQLLYEPWTLACGHTYCYSCLCNWFVPNKRKKTCPNCRTIVRQMPAPAFVIKQMTDIFINRAELMPMDETIDQHRERRKCETDAVEVDRGCETGLFKGCFKQAQGHLQFNEEDHMYRCSVCSHEYIGGPTCLNCGVDFGGEEDEIDMDGFSDADIEDSLEDYDNDDFHGGVDGDTDEDDADLHDGIEGFHEHWGGPNSPLSVPSDQDESIHWESRPPNAMQEERRMHLDEYDSESSEDEVDDEEETESMRDFIINDEVDHHNIGLQGGPSSPSHASLSSGDQDDGGDDDEYDEGGEVSNGRRRPTVRWGGTRSIVTVTDSAPTSDAGDLTEESRHLGSGWSPLQEEPDSDDGARQAFMTMDRSDNGDSDTTVGNQASDEDDEDRHRENSSRPLWKPYRSRPPYSNDRDRGQSMGSSISEDCNGTDAYESDLQDVNETDREGDVEMSVSPVSSRRSSNTNKSENGTSRGSVEELGSSTAIHDVEEESSDGTVLPAARRRRQPRYFRHSQTPEYDPRISLMFAQHQSDLRDATARQSPYFEPASRSRNAVSYRLLPPRGPGLSSNPHPSSAVILTSVSNRRNRVQRQYSRRYFN